MARLVTFDEGCVGRVDGEEIVVLDVPTMREWFERGGAVETGERLPLVGAKLASAFGSAVFSQTIAPVSRSSAWTVGRCGVKTSESSPGAVLK